MPWAGVGSKPAGWGPGEGMLLQSIFEGCWGLGTWLCPVWSPRSRAWNPSWFLLSWEGRGNPEGQVLVQTVGWVGNTTGGWFHTLRF